MLIVCSCMTTFRSVPEEFCLRYSKRNGQAARCETVGDVNGSGSESWFGSLRSKARVMLPNYIPYCIGYNSRGFCDYCTSGRAFNGKSCEQCVKPPLREGFIKSDQCEFPWEDIVRALYSRRQRNVFGNIASQCRRLFNRPGPMGNSHWDHCIRMVSRYQFPTLSISRNERNRGKSFMLKTRGRGFLEWVRSNDNNKDDCNDPFTQGVCNCYATAFGGRSCSTCDQGWTKEGVLKQEMMDGVYFESDKDARYDTETWANYSNYKCSKSKVEHCNV